MSKVNILPVKPGTLNDADKAALRDAGVVVVEHENPSELRLLQPNADVPASDMLRCALKALCENDRASNYGTLQRSKFTQLIAEVYANYNSAPVQVSADGEVL